MTDKFGNYFKINGVEYGESLPFNINESIDFEHLNSFSRVPKIFLWTPFWHWKDFLFGLGYKKPFINNECPVFNCEITNDRTKFNESDLVVFHARTNFQFPHFRPRDQRWIFAEFEPPTRSPNYKKFNNIFNFTFTYRVESEFSRPSSSGYRMFEWARNFSFDENKDFSKGKTGFAAAVISHCNANNQIGKKYKFYLSFENSICNGYITEKFFEILRYDIIPIVLGGGHFFPIDLLMQLLLGLNEYLFIQVPKSGFINVLDYKNPKELDILPNSNICDMCLMLNLENEVPIRRNIVNQQASVPNTT
ncbi:alpha-(1-3)-fucosyltransferase C-like [Brachionus plicatilis]|uniref:Fucosyltransferase n=1 Tax=Brachionus plicatilis TaxID=10195 RepID=A0A3M7QTY5_BRAPC|nr:alpha-(1-3)-fucosyltransferase C-like [Brachionus plicatilis]